MEERYTVAIKEMPSEERPRERLQRYGPQVLSLGELLAIVLRTGTKERSAIALADHLLKVHGGIRGVANASVDELAKVKGIGPVKGVQIAACVELGKRLSSYTEDSRPCIRTPEDVSHLLMAELRDARKEHFVALLMDTKNRVVKKVTVSVGTLDASIVHPREVFKDAVACSAAAVIVAHNHPSGDPTPSPEDRQVTARLCEAGRVMGIEVLDHVVLGDGRWVSLKQLGWM
jgi:DNA repair protein RadC